MSKISRYLYKRVFIHISLVIMTISASVGILKKSLPYFSILLENNKNKNLVYSLLASPQRDYILKAIIETVHNLLLNNIVLNSKQKNTLKPFKGDLLQLVSGGKRKAGQKALLLLKVRRGRQFLKSLLSIAIPVLQCLLDNDH